MACAGLQDGAPIGGGAVAAAVGFRGAQGRCAGTCHSLANSTLCDPHDQAAPPIVFIVAAAQPCCLTTSGPCGPVISRETRSTPFRPTPQLTSHCTGGGRGGALGQQWRLPGRAVCAAAPAATHRAVRRVRYLRATHEPETNCGHGMAAYRFSSLLSFQPGPTSNPDMQQCQRQCAGDRTLPAAAAWSHPVISNLSGLKHPGATKS